MIIFLSIYFANYGTFTTRCFYVSSGVSYVASSRLSANYSANYSQSHFKWGMNKVLILVPLTDLSS